MSKQNVGRSVKKAQARYRGIGLILSLVARGAAVYKGEPARNLIAQIKGL